MAITNSIRTLFINWDADNILQNLRLRAGAGMRGGTAQRKGLEFQSANRTLIELKEPVRTGKWRLRVTGMQIYSQISAVQIYARDRDDAHTVLYVQDIVRGSYAGFNLWSGSKRTPSQPWGTAPMDVELCGDFLSDLNLVAFTLELYTWGDGGPKSVADFEVWGR